MSSSHNCSWLNMLGVAIVAGLLSIASGVCAMAGSLRDDVAANTVAGFLAILSGLTTMLLLLNSDVRVLLQRQGKLERIIATEAERARNNEAIVAAEAERARNNEAIVAAEAERARNNEAIVAAEAERARNNEAIVAAEAERARSNEAIVAAEALRARKNEINRSDAGWTDLLEMNVIQAILRVYVQQLITHTFNPNGTQIRDNRDVIVALTSLHDSQDAQRLAYANPDSLLHVDFRAFNDQQAVDFALNFIAQLPQQEAPMASNQFF